MSTLTVDTAQFDRNAEVFRVCVGEACSYEPDEPAASLRDFPEVTFAERDGSLWLFYTFPTPDSVTVQLYDSSETVLRRFSQPVDWARDDGRDFASARCAGPARATIHVEDG